MRKLISLLFLLILLVACSQKEEDNKPIIPSEEEKTYIASLEENTLSSSSCQFLITKESVIEGTIITKKFIGYCSGGGCEGNDYWGIKTSDNCLFYLDSKGIFGRTKKINDTVRILGIITKKMDAHGGDYFDYEIRHIKEVSSDFTMEPKEREIGCTKKVICPEGQEATNIQKYTGGGLDGCPFKWECQ